MLVSAQNLAGLTDPGPVRDAADARVATFTRPLVPIALPNNLAVFFGDSHTASTGDAAATTPQQREMDSYHFWARFYLDGRLRQVRNAGINGNTSTQALARMQADVIDRLPDGGICVVMLGTNDVLQGGTLATFKTNMAAIVNGLIAAGIIPVLLTIPPIGLNADPPNYLNPGSSNRTAPQLLMQAQINEWLLAYGAANGVRAIDLARVITNETNAAFPTNYTADGIHGLPRAKRIIGRALADAIGPELNPTQPFLAQSNIDPRNAVANGLFLNNDGVLPTGWAKANANAITTVVGDVAGIRGKALTVTGWDRAATNIINAPVLNGFSTGDVVAVAYKYKSFGMEAKGLRPSIGLRAQSGTFSKVMEQWTEADVPDVHTVYMQHAITQASVTQVRLTIEPGTLGNANPTTAEGFSMGELTIRNLTTGALVTL